MVSLVPLRGPMLQLQKLRLSNGPKVPRGRPYSSSAPSSLSPLVVIVSRRGLVAAVTPGMWDSNAKVKAVRRTPILSSVSCGSWLWAVNSLRADSSHSIGTACGPVSSRLVFSVSTQTFSGSTQEIQFGFFIGRRSVSARHSHGNQEEFEYLL